MYRQWDGATAKVVYIALGALNIQVKLGLTDEEMVGQIKVNPYLKHFIGYGSYWDKPQFH